MNKSARLSQYPNYGIALLLGIPVESGEVIDALDVDDDRLLKLVRNVLGLNQSEGSPALRPSEAGETIWFGPLNRSNRLWSRCGKLEIDFGEEADSNADIIHTDTGKQYEVIGQSLLELDFAELPESETGTGGLGNIDFLAGGKLTVMPPSIHPDTEKPYEVVGKPLLEVDFVTLQRWADANWNC